MRGPRSRQGRPRRSCSTRTPGSGSGGPHRDGRDGVDRILRNHRSPDLFDGLGSRTLRRDHLIHRAAFLRAIFRRSGFSEVTVYRGMASEAGWIDRPRSILSCAFSLRVARSFASSGQDSPHKTSYLMKLTIPIERLWMTHCETRALNGRYREAEALVINHQIGPFPTLNVG